MFFVSRVAAYIWAVREGLVMMRNVCRGVSLSLLWYMDNSANRQSLYQQHLSFCHVCACPYLGSCMIECDMGRRSHFKPKTVADRLALWMVRLLAYPRAWIFQDRHTHHLLVLETVAAIPGMVAGALIHFSCLRRIADDKGWIETLIKEAETERRHLLVIREIVEPTFFDRIMIWVGQLLFVVLYFFVYIICPRACHRFVGYLEEDAVDGYDVFLKYLAKHPEEDGVAPQLAHTFWDMPKKAKISDLIQIILQEEMRHRDVNHTFASQLVKKKR